MLPHTHARGCTHTRTCTHAHTRTEFSSIVTDFSLHNILWTTFHIKNVLILTIEAPQCPVTSGAYKVVVNCSRIGGQTFTGFANTPNIYEQCRAEGMCPSSPQLCMRHPPRSERWGLGFLQGPTFQNWRHGLCSVLQTQLRLRPRGWMDSTYNWQEG